MKGNAASQVAVRRKSSRLCRTLVCWTSALALVGLVAAPSALADDGLTGAVGQATSAVADPTPVTSAVAPVTAAAAQPVAAATAAASTATATATNAPETGPVAGAAATATQAATRAASPVSEVRSTPQAVERSVRATPHNGANVGPRQSAPKSTRSTGKARSATPGSRSPAAFEMGTQTFVLPTGAADASGLNLANDASATAEATSASAGHRPAPRRQFPWPTPLGSKSTVAAGAATALLLLLLFLFAEGLASAPPSFPRMLSLRRLLPTSYPFLLELERPD